MATISVRHLPACLGALGTAVALALSTSLVPALAADPQGGTSVNATSGSEVAVAEIATSAVDASAVEGASVASLASGQARSGSAQPTASRLAPGAVKARSVVFDRPEDVASGTVDQQYVKSVSLRQDVATHRISVTFTYRATPTASAESIALAYLGTWRGNTCEPTFVIGGAGYQNAGTAGSVAPGAVRPSPVKSGSGPAKTFSIVKSAYTANYTCGYAIITTALDPPQRLATFYAKNLQVTKVPAPKKPVLKIEVVGKNFVPVRKGAKTKLTVRITNRGDAAAKKITLKYSGSSLKFSKKKLKISSLAPWKQATKTVTVRLAGTKTRKATVKVAASKAAAKRASVKFAYQPTPKKLKSLNGQMMWGFDSVWDKGWTLRFAQFNSKYVYLGRNNSKYHNCKKASKSCVRYTYSPRTGKITVGKKKGKVNSAGLTLAGKYYYRVAKPGKGAKLNVSLVHRDYIGCGVQLYCSTWTEYLILKKDGRFVKSTHSIASTGTPGFGTIFASSSPKNRGRYKVLSGGRIELRYDSKKKVRVPIGFELNYRGKASPKKEGMLVGGTNFYR